jgi:tetratricopeptide (TPR) repeat protein
MARHELKSVAGHDLDQAQRKAEKYRDLNQPDESDSICQDILAVDPGHQAALKTLGLSITDRFSGDGMQLRQALEVFAKIKDAYERTYLAGIAWERHAKAQLAEGIGPGAYDAFQNALDLFEDAEELAPEKDPDPILRWNRCVRELTTHPLLRAAAEQAPMSQMDFGDGPPG